MAQTLLFLIKDTQEFEHYNLAKGDIFELSHRFESCSITYWLWNYMDHSSPFSGLQFLHCRKPIFTDCCEIKQGMIHEDPGTCLNMVPLMKHQ